MEPEKEDFYHYNANEAVKLYKFMVGKYKDSERVCEILSVTIFTALRRCDIPKEHKIKLLDIIKNGIERSYET